MLSSTSSITVPAPVVFAPADPLRQGTAPRTHRPSPFAPTHIFPNLRPLVTLALTLVLSLALGASTAMAADKPSVVNINTAETADLALLPRVGPALSQRIVEFREENGKFGDPAELMLVQGIGERTFELLEPYITLEGETTLDTKVRTRDAQERLDARQDEDLEDEARD